MNHVLLVAKVQFVLLEFGTIPKRHLQSFLEGRHVIRGGFRQFVTRVDRNGGKLRIHTFRNHGLEHFLLLHVRGLGDDEALLTGGKLGFGLHNVEGGESADLRLSFVVVHKLLRVLDGGLGHADLVLVGQQDIVSVNQLGEARDHLLAKNAVSHFQVVLGDADEHRVRAIAEPLEQMLIESDRHTRSNRGIEQ